MISVYEQVELGSLEGVLACLRAGHDPNKFPEGTRRTPLSLAAERGHLNIVLALCGHPNTVLSGAPFGFTCHLSRAASRGHVDVVDVLIAAGADVNEEEENFSTPLIYAFYTPGVSLQIVQKLVQAGADVNAQVRDYGSTALQSAAAKGNLDIVRFLLDNGASLILMDSDGHGWIITFSKHLEYKAPSERGGGAGIFGP